MIHKCPKCNYLTELKCNLQRHYVRKHPPVENSEENIEQNVEQKDSNVEKTVSNVENIEVNVENSEKPTIAVDIFKCDKCTKTFSTKPILHRHSKICKGVSNSLECHLCHEIFKNAYTKSRHLKKCSSEQKSNNETKLINCDKCHKCTKILSSNRNLKNHISTCKGVSNPLECYNCHKIFNNSAAKCKHLKKCSPPPEPINEVIEEPIKYKKISIPQCLRKAVWNTYIGREIGETKCPVCKNSIISPFEFHCGHIIAESKGGITNLENLRPVCKSCNSSMRTLNLETFKNKYFNV
jgi:hypothetical protein